MGLRPDQFKQIGQQHAPGAAVSHQVHAELQQAYAALKQNYDALGQRHFRAITLLAAMVHAGSPPRAAGRPIRLTERAVLACDTAEVRQRLQLYQDPLNRDLLIQLQPEPQPLIVLP